jgi:hypothetical protein
MLGSYYVFGLPEPCPRAARAATNGCGRCTSPRSAHSTLFLPHSRLGFSLCVYSFCESSLLRLCRCTISCRLLFYLRAQLHTFPPYLLRFFLLPRRWVRWVRCAFFFQCGAWVLCISALREWAVSAVSECVVSECVVSEQVRREQVRRE